MGGGGGWGDGDLFPFSRSFVAVLANFSFWGGEWAQSYNSMKFLTFPSFLRSEVLSRLATLLYHVYY